MSDPTTIQGLYNLRAVLRSKFKDATVEIRKELNREILRVERRMGDLCRAQNGL